MKIYLSIIWDCYFSIISVKWFTFLNYCCIGVFYDGSWSTFLLNIQASFCHFLVRHGKIISRSFHQKLSQLSHVHTFCRYSYTCSSFFSLCFLKRLYYYHILKRMAQIMDFSSEIPEILLNYHTLSVLY